MLFFRLLVFGWALSAVFQDAHALLAGGEFDLPSDSPSNRLDNEGLFNFSGALEISAGGYLYRGSATVLSPHWALSAGHNVDFNDDGLVDNGLSINLHLPGIGSYSASNYMIHPDFTGFGNPSIRYPIFFFQSLGIRSRWAIPQRWWVSVVRGMETMDILAWHRSQTAALVSM